MSTTHTFEILEEGIALLTLCRPEQLNALSWELVDGLSERFADIARNDAIRVVILTGKGRGFCSGIDIGGDDAVGSTVGVVDAYRSQQLVASLATSISELRQPVIAAVNGPAAGGGLALALASDIRLGAPEARFNVAFVRIGLSGADVGVSYFLPRVVGLGVASELMLTGRQVHADEALRIGLLNRIVAPDALLDEACALARQIVANSPFGVELTKQVLRQNVDAPSLAAAISVENKTQILATRTDDMKEALGAFLDRRDPSFTGR